MYSVAQLEFKSGGAAIMNNLQSRGVLCPPLYSA